MPLRAESGFRTVAVVIAAKCFHVSVNTLPVGILKSLTLFIAET